MRRVVALAAVLLMIPVASRAAPPTRPATAIDHLKAMVARSPAPEYRRFGSPGMARVAAYETAVLANAGYRVWALVFPLDRLAVVYVPPRRPDLVCLANGMHVTA